MSQTTLLSRIGHIRLILLSFTVMSFPMVSLTDAEPIGFGIFTAYVVPALVVIFFFLLALDALMSRIFMVDLVGEERKPGRMRVALSLCAIAGIAYFWGPYFQTVGNL